MSHHAVRYVDNNQERDTRSITSDFTFSEQEECLTLSDTSEIFKPNYHNPMHNFHNHGHLNNMPHYQMNHNQNGQMNGLFLPYNNYYGQVPMPVQRKNNNTLNLQLFKTIECGIKTYHDHKQCPYFHTPKDRRRNTQYYQYEPEICPNLIKET
jgi:hypothetical protein